jgi:hypothetical protein
MARDATRRNANLITIAIVGAISAQEDNVEKSNEAQGLISIRECAGQFAAAYAEHGNDFPAFVEVATPVCARLLERPDLLTQGFSIGTHRATARLLYNDGELTIVVGHEPPQTPIPIHDHGMWEMLGLYRGRLDHSMYERLDDQSQPGFADLGEIDRRVMKAGDVICVPPPPHDLHGFTAMTQFTYLVAILPGWYDDVRSYFDVAGKSYYRQGRTPV